MIVLIMAKKIMRAGTQIRTSIVMTREKVVQEHGNDDGLTEVNIWFSASLSKVSASGCPGRR